MPGGQKKMGCGLPSGDHCLGWHYVFSGEQCPGWHYVFVIVKKVYPLVTFSQILRLNSICFSNSNFDEQFDVPESLLLEKWCSWK